MANEQPLAGRPNAIRDVIRVLPKLFLVLLIFSKIAGYITFSWWIVIGISILLLLLWIVVDRTPLPKQAAMNEESPSPSMENLGDILSSFRSPPYDIFISYRTLNLDTVRPIVDHLVASGVKVWFNEYEVLLHDYDDFQQAIDKGTRHSSYGLAFTNDDYADSKYCPNEMKQLLDHCGLDRVMEIRLSEHAHKIQALFDKLGNRPDRSCKCGQLPDYFSFIEDSTGWNIKPIDLTAENHSQRVFQGTCIGCTYTLNIAGWEITKQGGKIDPLGTIQGPELRRAVPGNQIFVNLHAGPELSREAIRESADDRRMYDQLRNYAPRHLERLGAKLIGLHLIRVGGAGQMALTYWMPQGYWTRKYSIILPHPESGEAAEFVFTFGFPGKFESYCLYVHLMDRLVASLEWRKRTTYPEKDLGKMLEKITDLNSKQRFKEAASLCDEALGHLRSVSTGREIIGVLTDEKAFALCGLGRFTEALACCEGGLDLYPQIARLWNTKGLILAQLGRSGEAVEALEKYIALAPPEYKGNVESAKAAILMLRSKIDGR